MENYVWQKEAVEQTVNILTTTKPAIVVNTSDTGTGKTYITSNAIALLSARESKIFPVFVIAPLSIQTQWRNVLKEYGLTCLDVVNIEKLVRGKSNSWYRNNQWNLPEGCIVVIDEAHKGGCTPNSKTNPILARLKAVSWRGLILQSATLADSPLKMRGTGYLLGLHKFNASSFYGWCRKHACSSSPFHSGLEFSKGPRGREAMAKINESLKPIMVRLRISEIPGFPECDTEATLFDLAAEYQEEINEAYAEMNEKLKEPGVNEMVELQKARQRTEFAKLALLEDLIETHREEEKSVVVFLNFTAPLLELHKRCGGVLIYGEQNHKEREASRELFQSNKETLCIVNCDAGGLGISLHDLNHTRPRMALITPPWSATTVRQVLGRVHRAGGTKAQQLFVLAAGTPEERVYAAVKRKLGNLDALNDNDMK